ncbi:tyrosine-type recombinase/integrase [Enterococcus sp. 5H]|uniref:tyrosine-type recombinase/integrase n=1 Tax=Enterococcus sp. 5H TaxID=1229490 RepID=UPI0023048CDB|nr:site-specific integrase [Enterococcus sp. 5H]MDA9472553.1 site-specific recombinase, phage integrase family [Enterococcus sp. 5H]
MSRKGENIYHRKDGRWEGRYIKGRNPKGRIHYGYIYGHTYKEVKRKLIVEQQQTIDINSLKQYKGTVRHWFSYWLEDIVNKEKKITTYSSYKSKIECHIIPVLGSLSLAKLTKNDIDNFIITTKKKVAVSSLHSIFRVLICGLNSAEKKGYIEDSVYKKCVLPKNNSKNKKKILSQQDFHNLIIGAKKHKHGLATIIALETGLRIGEIAGLKWEDIDENNKTLKVRRTLQRVSIPDKFNNGKSMIVELSPKTYSSIREIPLSFSFYDLLIRERKKNESQFIISNKGKFSEPRLIRRRFFGVLCDLGLPNIPFHSLRHMFATRALRCGVDIAIISSILGHSSTQMTLDVYTYSTIDEEREAIQKISFY